MSECRVIFDQDLSEEEVYFLTDAIRMFKGVRRVEAKQGYQNSSNQRVSASISPPSRDEGLSAQNFNAGAAPPNFNTGAPPPNMPTGDTFQTQRHVIDEAIRWGVKNNKIQLEDIQSLSAEEIVQYAFKFIDMMPEELRAKLGGEASAIFNPEDTL